MPTPQFHYALETAHSIQLFSTPTVQNLVVVDPAISKHFDLVSYAHKADKFVLLNTAFSGIEQITAALSEFATVSSLQLIASGAPGQMKLGSVWLNALTLETYSDQFQIWRRFLTATANILLSGSQVGHGVDGMAFAGRLSQLTGAIVTVAND